MLRTVRARFWMKRERKKIMNLQLTRMKTPIIMKMRDKAATKSTVNPKSTKDGSTIAREMPQVVINTWKNFAFIYLLFFFFKPKPQFDHFTSLTIIMVINQLIGVAKRRFSKNTKAVTISMLIRSAITEA